MNILIFFAIIFVTIILAILINRIVKCPTLVGFVFFSITLLIAIILSSIALVILSIILGIIAFASAFLDCIFKRCAFFRNNCCLQCHNPYENDCNNSNNENNNRLTIINSNGEVVARINGNSITCTDDNGCGCGGKNNLLSEVSTTNLINNQETTSSCNNCGCNRSYKRNRYY